MQSKLRLLSVFACFACFAGLAAVAHAQDSAPAPLSAETQNFLLTFITALAVKYPFIATVITLLGTLRLWLKPVFSAVHAIVDLTPTKLDDGYWAKAYDFFTSTATGRFLAWLLDYVASIKLIPPGGKPISVDTPPAA
jgi:hypothetical protein